MTKAERRERLLRLLRDLAALSGDTEAAHVRADDALLDFIGDDEISDAYNAIEKWYA